MTSLMLHSCSNSASETVAHRYIVGRTSPLRRSNRPPATSRSKRSSTEVASAIASATPKRFRDFALNIPARQADVPKLTIIEAGKSLPFPDPPPPSPDQTAEPSGQPHGTVGRRNRRNPIKINNVRCDHTHDTLQASVGIASQVGRLTAGDKRSFFRLSMT